VAIVTLAVVVGLFGPLLCVRVAVAHHEHEHEHGHEAAAHEVAYEGTSESAADRQYEHRWIVQTTRR
jgi:hypothetical protein